LLFAQKIFYSQGAPPNIFSMIKQIREEEGRYIVTHSVSYIRYAKSFFNVILFQHLPLGIGATFHHGWLWAMLLLAPVFGYRKISNKPLFAAIVASGMFLFVFHRFYGYSELPLYSPVIMCAYLSLFAFITQTLPSRIITSLCCPLLAIMLFFNFFGFYTVHRISQYVFGSADIADHNEYAANINMLKEHIKDCQENVFFISRYTAPTVKSAPPIGLK
jgi:hypothetical protein